MNAGSFTEDPTEISKSTGMTAGDDKGGRLPGTVPFGDWPVTAPEQT